MCHVDLDLGSGSGSGSGVCYLSVVRPVAVLVASEICHSCISMHVRYFFICPYIHVIVTFYLHCLMGP